MITNYAANIVLGGLTGSSATMTFGSLIYVGLSTTTPNAAGGNVTEPVGNGYARVLLGYSTQSYTIKMTTPSLGATENKEIIFFPEATGNWGTITHFCIYGAATGGNLLAYGALETPIIPIKETIPIVRVGELKISLA